MATPLPKPSEEQELCLKDLREGNHVIIKNSVAGSGKTSTILHAALQYIDRNPEGKVLYLSYNRQLVDSSNEQLRACIPGISSSKWNGQFLVTTYHGLLGSLARCSVDNDLIFVDCMASLDFASRRANWYFSDFNLLIIDEAQDIRDSYLQLLTRLIYQVCKRPRELQIFVVGDVEQLLYDFYTVNRADGRFLSNFSRIVGPLCFNPKLSFAQQKLWKQRSLTRSYRSTPAMANVINALQTHRETQPHIPWEEEGVAAGIPWVTWCIADLYQDAHKIILPIALRERGNLLVLCPSLNQRSKVAMKIVDHLVDHRIDVHVCRSGSLADSTAAFSHSSGSVNASKYSITRNKVCFKTFHAAKGLQFPVVVVLLKNNIFPSENHNPLVRNGRMSNAEYVALTRASRELIVIQDCRKVVRSDLERFASKMQQRDLRVVALREFLEESEDQKKYHEQSLKSPKRLRKTTELEKGEQQQPTKKPFEHKNLLSEAEGELNIKSNAESNTRSNTESNTKSNAPEEEDDKEEEEDSSKIPSSFSVDTLFSFMDVTHLRELLKQINIVSVKKPLVDCDVGGSESASTAAGEIAEEQLYAAVSQQEFAALRSAMLQSYFHQMNVSFDQGLTYVNVASICGLALSMALEYSVTRLNPTLLEEVRIHCSWRDDEKHKRLKITIDKISQTLKTFASEQSMLKKASEKKTLFPLFKVFAQTAALVDAHMGYGEKIMSLKNFDFIDKTNIFERFLVLQKALSFILITHNVKPSDLVWYREETGRFQYEGKSIRITARPTVSSKDGSLVINILHKNEINHDDHLTSAATAQIVGDKKTNMYIINIGDGSIHSVSLVHSKKHSENNHSENNSEENQSVYLKHDKTKHTALPNSKVERKEPPAGGHNEDKEGEEMEKDQREDQETVNEGSKFVRMMEDKENGIHEPDESLEFIGTAVGYKIIKETCCSDKDFFKKWEKFTQSLSTQKAAT